MADNTYLIHPLEDSRWNELVAEHHRSSVFHTTAWLEALRRTYGYQPLAFTTSPPGVRLSDALVFCAVRSWITGQRLISLPFSDHCEPLVDNEDSRCALIAALNEAVCREKSQYLEIRAREAFPPESGSVTARQSYCFHKLDLGPDLGALFHRCHRACTQRKILRAKREGLVYRSGQTPALLEAFWRLQLITRQRHGIPPQPKNWFRNLIGCFGDALQIRVAYHNAEPVASILTLRHRATLVYKYGCSDVRFNKLGGTQLLFWKAIEEAKVDGLAEFDLGRSDLSSAGLIRFKDRWGSARSALTYVRYYRAQAPRTSGMGMPQWIKRVAKAAVPCMPAPVLDAASSIFYRHFA